MKNNNPVKPKILYVDDNKSNLILFKATFENEYDIFLAESGMEGLKLLAQNNFSVIISDQVMPVMTGIELLEIVQEKYPEVMRFIITAYSDYEVVVDSINKGQIYGYFNKPFDPSVVRASLNKAIEVYELRESNRKMLTYLEKANRGLRENDKSKTRFLSIISNEIRTPINKIMSTIHVLKDKMGTNELIGLLNYLDASVSRLESFSSAANQLSRLNDQIQPVSRTNVSLNELVELSIIEKKILLDETGIQIELAANDRDIMVKGESELLIICLSNLIVNSLNHTEYKGKIRILTGEDKGTGFIEITDHGINYSGKQLDNLINFFSEEGVPFDYNAGIEMVLAKQVIISHGGRIEIIQNDDKTVTTRMIFPDLAP